MHCLCLADVSNAHFQGMPPHQRCEVISELSSRAFYLWITGEENLSWQKYPPSHFAFGKMKCSSSGNGSLRCFNYHFWMNLLVLYTFELQLPHVSCMKGKQRSDDWEHQSQGQ